MYYPKSQIKTNLYTNGGEFVVLSTGLGYRGSYYKISTGQTFTGPSPSKDSQELVPLENGYDGVTLKKSEFITVKRDVIGSPPLPSQLPLLRYLPLAFSPYPTQEDYNVGEFQRYFAKKINELIYIETDKDTYSKLVEQNPELYYEQYFPFSLPWDVSGEKQQVYKTNKNIVERMMVKNRLPKFGEYLRFDYLKYYK